MTSHTDSFTVTDAQRKYLEQQLDRVSRSFAILIPFIERPLRHYLAVAYLLCRVADNIEDCGQPRPWKMERFDEFMALLQAPQKAPDQLANWDKRSWPGLNSDERQMMGVRTGAPLWHVYAMMPIRAQIVVQRWVSAMAAGMSRLGDPDEHPYFVKRAGIDVLTTEVDYNEYCYIVAGTVGELATELVVHQYQLDHDQATVLHALAGSCGRCLQKTNIVKDFVEDLERGVCYLPANWLARAEFTPLHLAGAGSEWKAMVLADVLDELRDAQEYALALPPAAKGYRRASLMCLFPAYHTMLSAAQQHKALFTSGHQIKISRGTIAQCISDSQKILFDDDAIRQYCTQIEETIYDYVGQPIAMPQS